jgi:molecular chaperone HtpG
MTVHAFQAEVGRVLSLVVNSLYSNKEIFLRELVSNASDALDKLRFRALTEPGLMEGESTLAVRIRPVPEKGQLVIEDTGIGMTEAELVENLGTIARSGSQAFLEKLEASAKKDVGIIGQFGVGFYSAFLVADRVDVISRAAGAEHAFKWSSSGKDTFSVEAADAERPSRGTSVVLHLRDDQKELLEHWRLRDLVRRYSDYIAYPIELDTDTKREKINEAAALWQKPKTEITDQQYAELYRHLTHELDEPIARTHFRVEGNLEFVGLLWIPSEPPFDLDDPRKHRGMKLFVKRVLIMDDCDALLPQWLRFVRGLVDSEDLPLNVSRELLQDSSSLRTIKKQLTKRAVDLLDEIAKERPGDYEKIWAAFGRILKEGLAVDAEWKDRLAKLTRWPSTRGDALVSLDEYVAAMKEGQDTIYYVTGESKAALVSSPYLEALRAKGYEVLLLTDHVDTWAAEALAEYEGKKLVHAMRADAKLPETDAKVDEEAKKTLGPLIDVAKSALGDRVRDVKPSARLVDSPACLVLGPTAMPAHLEKLLRQSGKTVPRGKRDLELNPAHPAVKRLAALAAEKKEDPELGDLVLLLHDQALLAEGSPVEDPGAFAKRLGALMTKALG